MRLAIMQPYFFPYLGYYQLLNAVDTFVIFDDVNYINKGYINRNAILVNGQPHKITLELIDASQNKLINEIEIGNNKQKLLKTIELGYKKAPFFHEAFPLLAEILLDEEKNLAKFIGASLEKIAAYLNLQTNFVYSSAIDKDTALRAQDKILNICTTLKTKDYLNAIGGQALYDKNAFIAQGINLSFIKPNLQQYKQYNDEFVPALSIIDILMFNTKENISTMLNQYTLI